MHSMITITGDLADALGEKFMHEMGATVAKEAHQSVLINVHGGKLHDGAAYHIEAPPAIPVRLVKLGKDEWMVQARYGVNHDGNPYNAAGGSVTFPTQDKAKEWLMTEPPGRWKIVL